MRQAEANDFTDAQVQQYIEGQISIMIDSQIISHEEAVLSEDGSNLAPTQFTAKDIYE